MNNSIRALVNQCCNLFDDNHCVFKGKKCNIKEGRRCEYFEQSVLPVNKALKALYHMKYEAEAHGDKLSKEKQKSIIQENSELIKCKCGKEFKPKSNRQKYCDRCRKAKRNERQKILMKNKRHPVSI